MIYCYLKVYQHIKVCDEIDFDNILFDLALWGVQQTFMQVFLNYIVEMLSLSFQRYGV
jgi:hypothetical protein